MNQLQQQQQQSQLNMQMGSGLTRYRSAPSSYFSSVLNNNNTPLDGGGFGDDDFAQLFNPRASSPETQRIFARFMNSADNDSQSQPLPQSQSQLNSQFLAPKTEPDQAEQPLQRQRSNDYSSVSQIMYHNQSHNSEAAAASSGIESNYNSRNLSSFNSNRGGGPVKMETGGVNPGLTRHSSSPAGLFANINMEDFGAMRGIGNFGAGNFANAEATFSSASRFNSPMDFSSRNSAFSGMLPTISENKGIEQNNPGDGQFDQDHGFPVNPWDDPAILSDEFLKELAENDRKTFSKPNVSSDDQNNEGGNRCITRLSHHLSLPKSLPKPSVELSAMEKLLQDSVPCKIRAKRGFATHPRSIAERVRRTKISERMRKLQELVPNMEKQTNTADMLDLAVDYIKDLQRQQKMLSDNREKCSCPAKTKS